jgi:hypothetical protein
MRQDQDITSAFHQMPDFSTALWSALSNEEKEGWDSLARSIKPIYRELDQVSSVPCVSEIHHYGFVRHQMRVFRP